jgi:hypothetical protein
VSNFTGSQFPDGMFSLYRASNQSINLTGTERVLKGGQLSRRQVISPLCFVSRAFEVKEFAGKLGKSKE